MDVTILYKGNAALEARYKLKDLTKDELVRHCSNYIVEDFINARIDNISHTPVDSVYSEMKLRFTVTFASLFTKAADLSMARINPFHIFNQYSWLKREKRLYPLLLPYRFTIEKNITVQLPDQYYGLRSLPEKLSLTNKNMEYDTRYQDLGGGKLKLQETFSLKENRITPQHYSEFRNLVEQVKNKSEEKIILNKK